MATAKRLKTDPEVDVEGEDQQVVDVVLQSLDEVQQELDRINDEASDKVLEVEQEYNKHRRPVYEKRRDIIAGLPGFWQTALVQHQVLRDTCTDEDISVLGYCTEVDVQDFEDIKSGFKITFRFTENPYFDNTELTKTFNYSEDGTLTIRGTVPEWKEGMAPAEDNEPAPGQRRVPRPDYRFFEWFVDEEQLAPGQHDDIADIIKEEIWPNPTKFYRGEVPDADADVVFDGEDLVDEGEAYGEGFEPADAGGEAELYEVDEGEGVEVVEGEEYEGEGQEFAGEGEEGLEGDDGAGAEGEDDQ